ncbi:DEAD/DEAH box helicase [Winogradskya consettensis]|uniref:Helicase HelZ n=1 Tax=Winogradskya consettensis TaxID=113560 RepID=A0A919VVX2_9ACTN|nr:DEAD/DEAH box helicase [Actinoplanes consettensis]GIM71293.1 helicase HelZ [Actinoplanes consettensis]
MTVLHGFIARDGALALWGEAGPASGSASAGNVPPAAGVRRGEHPSAFVPGGVTARGASTLGELRTSTVLLPSTSAGPLPSPGLGLAARRGVPKLRPWVVPAVVVPFVTEEMADEFGARAAASVAYLAEVCAFAADLVARGRVLPGVRPGEPRGRSRAEGARGFWRPVLTGPDAARHAALVERMPPACRAERARPGDVDGLPAADALHAALHRLVDGLVRTRLAEAGITLTGAPWLTALTTDDGNAAPTKDGNTAKAAPDTGTVDAWRAKPGELDILAEALDEWHAEASSGSVVRVVFRLSHLHEVEPDEPDATSAHDTAPPPDAGPEDAWLLEFLLQPLEEPSLLVSATEVWQDAIAPLRRWTQRPQDRLIAGLGQAARVFGDLEAALRVARPAELVLDTEGAYRFLGHAEVLEQAGFGVLLPKWWREPLRFGLALEVRSREAAAHVLRDETTNLATLVGYDWGLALGGKVLTDDELAELARVKVPLVRLRGRWVYLDAQRLRTGLEFLKRGGGTMTAGGALRLVRLMPPEEVPLPVTEVRGRGWVADLLGGRLGERLELIEPPPELTGVLRAYQMRGYSWLSFLDGLGLGALLADDMGLGKTVQLLALLLGSRRGPTLLICPLSVLGNWQREAARFAPSLRVRVLHGADRAEPAELADGADVVLTTYATATLDADELARVGWDRVVLDEAQHIKNSASGTAKAVRRFPARSRIALTGTPVENRLAEMWSILDFLNPGLLGSAHTFRNRYAVPIERYADEDAAARLRQATRPFLLRRVKSDPSVIDDLPAKRLTRHLCGLTTEQATLYRAVLDDMLLRMKQDNETRRKGYVLAAMTKLKQVCNHPAQLLGDGSPLAGRSGKLERLEEILDAALAEGESTLCFTQFARFGTMLVPHLAARFGVPVRYLHGGTPRGARDTMVADFQADRRPGIFVLSLKAGGTGLNLTAANHVVHVDRWWNPATEAQATDRAYRIGQDRDVQVHTLVCLGTLEERIDRLLADKGVLAERVVGNGEGWLTTLSSDELLDLARLAPEAVGD